MSDDKPKRDAKCTQAEMDLRVDEVLNHILMGRPKSYIVRHAAEKWGIGERQTEEVMSRARAVMKEINAGSREESMEQVVSNFWLLYRQAMHKKDPYLALSILKEVAKIKGLNVENVVHTIEDKRDLKDVTNTDLEKSLENQVKQIHGSH